jgi:hypothetical protein
VALSLLTRRARFGIDAQELLKVRSLHVRGEATVVRDVATLRTEADRLLDLKPASVLDSPGVAASGDPHDYFSSGPYWWPDPAKPDGLPYIQRDGQVNPESRTSGDMPAFRRTCESVHSLGLAWFFTSDERYARKAAELTRVWFLAPATRMNANFQHAQGIPWHQPRPRHRFNRGAPSHAAQRWPRAPRRLACLAGVRCHGAPRLDGGVLSLADDEQERHGRIRCRQQPRLMVRRARSRTSRSSSAGPRTRKQVFSTAKTKRIARQIEPDGSQPQELRRTRSLNYVLFNLEALTLLARLGGHAGVDLWQFTTEDGRSLRAALRVAAPYVDPQKEWPKKDVSSENRARVLPLLIEALRHGEDREFRDLLMRFSPKSAEGEYWRLWWATRGNGRS